MDLALGLNKKFFMRGVACMKIQEIVGTDAEKMAADSLAKTATRLKQQATAAQAQVKMKRAQQQLSKATLPKAPK